MEFTGLKSFYGTSLFPYILLVMPRIIMCFLSFLNDYLIYKIYVLMKKDHKIPLLLFSSSYVTIVYLTRTFSNSLEVLFFSHVIFILCKFLFIQKNYENSDENKYTACLKLSFLFGVTLAAGIFNRPTFVCFTAFPVLLFFFLILQLGRNFENCVLYFVSFVVGIFCITFSFIAVDSLYYNKFHYTSLFNLQKHLTVTPLNFILYNINKKNLNSHGLHPYWLHICVNIPLLFSLYGVLMILYLIKYLIKIFKQNFLNLEMFLLLSFATPLFLLSLIPHQEPRFLIPLLFPFVLLQCYFSSNRIFRKYIFVYLWCFQNIISILFFGFLHQGGVYLSLSYIHSFLLDHSNCALVFYKTYMPPRYVLGLTEEYNKVKIYDFAGIDIGEFEIQINNMIFQSDPRYIHFVVPHDVSVSVDNLNILKSKYKLQHRNYIYPHLSTENLPKYNEFMDIIYTNSSLLHKIHQFKKVFSICILTFKVNTT
ncbi:GPI mannosyltransferase 4-like isoform X2 [Argiope bruennichi]|nr:GPI mannosyltransferase 4-like isoform X2 [Argiope bruennichi]